MEIKSITPSDEIWNKVRNYADKCSWKAGKSLANDMDKKWHHGGVWKKYIYL